jgi:hypothetical protein
LLLPKKTGFGLSFFCAFFAFFVLLVIAEKVNWNWTNTVQLAVSVELR